MAVTIVQTIAGRSTGAVDSFSLAFASNVTAGNLISVPVASYNSAAITAGALSDTRGHTYALDVEHPGNAGLGYSAAILSAKNISAGANTVTINVTGDNFYFLVLYELAGADASSPVDVTAEADGNNSSPATGNFTTGAAGMAIAVLTHEAGGNTSLTVGSGWTEDHENETVDADPYNAMHRTTAASTMYNADWTAGGAIPWVALAVNYKEASGGGATLSAGTNAVTFTAPTATSAPGASTRAAGVNSITVTAPAATLQATNTLAAGLNAITLTSPTAIAVPGASTRAAGVNSITFTAPSATISVGANFVTAGVASITFTNPTATVAAGASTLSAGLNAITFTAPSASVSVPAPAMGAISADGTENYIGGSATISTLAGAAAMNVLGGSISGSVIGGSIE